MYYDFNERDPMLHSAMGKEGKQVHGMTTVTPPSRCNDLWAAILFLAQVIVIGFFAVWKGLPAVLDQMENSQHGHKNYDFQNFFILLLGIFGLTVALSGFWMKLLMSYAESMIRVTLWCNVGLVIVFGLGTFPVSPVSSLIFLMLAAVNICYIYAVQNRIGFASANLKCACASILKFSGVFWVALALVIQQIFWLTVWSTSAIGIYGMFRESHPNCQDFLKGNTKSDIAASGDCGGIGTGFILFAMLVSLYWGQQVLQNILTCTVAGVVASWWYRSGEDGITVGALYRSVTTAFGSICLGSLFVSILQAMQAMARMLREKAQEEDNAALACVGCIAECILGCLESIMEYLNMWAYIYVGIYGRDFRTSAKAVMDLFRGRGWTAVINDDLASSALTFGAIGVGCVACSIGLIAVYFSPVSWFDVFGTKKAGYGVIGAAAFIAGTSVSMTMANVVLAALHTVFVCFAEDPIALQHNHPREYEDLISGWRQFHSDAIDSAFGSTV